MSGTNEEKIREALSKTGYELEFQVSEQLEKAGWTVINNKYYIDDVAESPREIDAVAYMVDDREGVSVYTVLIISCKKSEERTWVMLSKERWEMDPNTDWSPVTMWSNEQHIGFMLGHSDWKSNYVHSAGQDVKKLFEPEKHIFAFQEVDDKAGNALNDKNIFTSIISAMKSQNYEIETLEKRKKEKCVYNFNLVTVVDAPLVRAMYETDKTTIEQMKSDVYVGSYIVNKKETSSRVHIITASEFENKIGTYKNLHNHNISVTIGLIDDYYENCMQFPARRNLKLKMFNTLLHWRIRNTLRDQVPDDDLGKFKLDLAWDYDFNRVIIEVNMIHYLVDVRQLNSSQNVKTKTAECLKELYRYEGEFKFEEGIPF